MGLGAEGLRASACASRKDGLVVEPVTEALSLSLPQHQKSLDGLDREIAALSGCLVLRSKKGGARQVSQGTASSLFSDDRPVCSILVQCSMSLVPHWSEKPVRKRLDARGEWTGRAQSQVFQLARSQVGNTSCQILPGDLVPPRSLSSTSSEGRPCSPCGMLFQLRHRTNVPGAEAPSP